MVLSAFLHLPFLRTNGWYVTVMRILFLTGHAKGSYALKQNLSGFTLVLEFLESF